MALPKRNVVRIYAVPACVVAMGAMWMWGDLGAMRGAILFCAGIIVLSILIGIRSERRTRRRIAETERRLEVLRTRGYDALRNEIAEESGGKEAA